jgi:hypothetical protein
MSDIGLPSIISWYVGYRYCKLRACEQSAKNSRLSLYTKGDVDQ